MPRLKPRERNLIITASLSQLRGRGFASGQEETRRIVADSGSLDLDFHPEVAKALHEPLGDVGLVSLREVLVGRSMNFALDAFGFAPLTASEVSKHVGRE